MRYAQLMRTVVAAFMLSGSAAYAVPIPFTAVLSGANEIPANASPGIGIATVLLDVTAESIQITANFSNLTSTDVAAHIHCCAPQGMNVGVATTIPAFMGFPLGVTSGTFANTFSLTDSTFYNPAFVMTHGGTIASAEAAFIGGLESGQTYFNIHTVNFGGGEIRGQLLSAVAVPGPVVGSGLPSLLGGAGLLLWWRRRTTAAATPASHALKSTRHMFF
jgi:hypothetical protein